MKASLKLALALSLALPAAIPAFGQAVAPDATTGVSRSKKLILKDGNFQLVRDYQRLGDRVRYLSAERGDWEELPASLVDWDATEKSAKAAAASDEALAAKVKKQEAANIREMALDVDASLQVAPGTFLPPGEGAFVLEGKHVTQLEQVGSELKTDKKQFLKQVLVPIPVVTGKKNMEIPGAHAKIRIQTNGPEFYLREAPPDPDRTSPIQHSSRPGETGPEIELVRATVKGNKRNLGAIRSMFGEEIAQERNTVSMQRWDVAPNVYRFTLAEPLPPGEYVLAEILPGGMNMFVWDFGVEGPEPAKK